jgi:predicted nucleic acid-binding protein
VRYVVDCSVALKWFLPEESSDKALAVLSRVRSGEILLSAPEVLQPEFAHALRKFVVGQRIDRGEATPGSGANSVRYRSP